MAPPEAGAGAATAQAMALAESTPALLAPSIDGPAAARLQALALALLLAAATCLYAALALKSAVPLARGVALRLVAEALVQVDEPPARVDAVAVHGGGAENASRELAAIRFWKDGRVGRFVAMGGPLPTGDPDVTYARAVERRLRANGVPEGVIVPMPAGNSTAGELIALRRLAEAEGWRHVVLTSSRWHTRRIALLAGQVFRGSSVGWTVTGPPELGFKAEGWWGDRRARDIVLGEWAKIGFALLFPASP